MELEVEGSPSAAPAADVQNRESSSPASNPPTDCSRQGKRKQHRRAKKSRKRSFSGGEDEAKSEAKEAAEAGSSKAGPNTRDRNATLPAASIPKQVKNPAPTRGSRKRHQHHRPQPQNVLQQRNRAGGKQVYLRPTNCPLLNAPRNSTQFIIDDHENSDDFVNFAGAAGGGNGARNNSSSTTPRRDREDDDTFWAEYSERDFQSVYETAHQEEVAEWDRKRLCEEIASLERRQKELVSVLARLDPEVYLQKLQGELLSLQEVSKKLKAEVNPVLPDSSTNEEPDTQANGQAQAGGPGGADNASNPE